MSEWFNPEGAVQVWKINMEAGLDGVKSLKYERLELLDNGWIRCFNPYHDDAPEGQDYVDMYPPHAIESVDYVKVIPDE